MLIVDPDSTPLEAFKHGFWKGLAGPLSCYMQYELPPLSNEEIKPLLLQRKKRLRPLKKTAAEALRSDWEKVGQDMYRAIQKYAEQS